MHQFQVEVVGRTGEAEDIVSFELAGLDRQPLPPFSAGSHIDVQIREGLVRQYSLCNAPSERHRYLIGVLRDAASRGGSVALHDEIAVGSLLQISAPKNHFPLAHAGRTLLFAGGIGITPILCMAERLAVDGAQFEMHYCARTPQRTAFRERIAQAGFAERVHFHFDSGAAEQKLDAAAAIGAPDPDTHLYVCGPGGFIGHVVDTAQRLGWAPAQVHVEYFGAAAADASGDAAFDVKIAGSGQVVTIPAGQTVVQALAGHGIDIPVSCWKACRITAISI
jgi:vanillate O-demethylase ferredoxin subunit